MSKKLISVVIPVFNEELNIKPMYERIKKTFENLNYDFEIIFVDNRSTDNTISNIKELIDCDERVFGIEMSRNFGNSQPSYIAGMKFSKGEAVAMIDGDIQDPPEMIADFISKWESGYDVVYGIRVKRNASIVMRFAYKTFYRLFKMLSEVQMPLDAGDFGLVDRKVINVINKIDEKDFFFRGIRTWVGFKQTGLEYTRDDRKFGKTKYTLLDNIRSAKMGIFNFSYKPLELISGIALFFTIISIVMLIVYLILYFVLPNSPRGFMTTIVLILFLGSVQLFTLSIIGEYISKIFNEIKNRPRYIIDEVFMNKKIEFKEREEKEIISKRQ